MRRDRQRAHALTDLRRRCLIRQRLAEASTAHPSLVADRLSNFEPQMRQPAPLSAAIQAQIGARSRRSSKGSSIGRVSWQPATAVMSPARPCPGPRARSVSLVSPQRDTSQVGRRVGFGRPCRLQTTQACSRLDMLVHPSNRVARQLPACRSSRWSPAPLGFASAARQSGFWHPLPTSCACRISRQLWPK